MTDTEQIVVNVIVSGSNNVWLLLKRFLQLQKVSTDVGAAFTVNGLALEQWVVQHLKSANYAEVKTQATVTAPMLRFLMDLPHLKQISFPLSTDVQGYLVKQDGGWQLLSNTGAGERYWVYRAFDLLLELPRKEWLHFLRQSAKGARRHSLVDGMQYIGWS